MKNILKNQTQRKLRGMTLLELTVVIAVLIALMGASVFAFSSFREFRAATLASTILREIEVAQRDFLSNNPQREVTSLTIPEVASYLEGDGTITALPTAEGLDGETLTADITQSPPIWLDGASPYDPGPPTDGRWDVGRL